MRKYKILHLPTGTFVWQGLAKHSFYLDEEIFLAAEKKTYIFEGRIIDRLIDAITSNRNYFCKYCSVSEHFECVEVEENEKTV